MDTQRLLGRGLGHAIPRLACIAFTGNDTEELFAGNCTVGIDPVVHEQGADLAPPAIHRDGCQWGPRVAGARGGTTPFVVNYETPFREAFGEAPNPARGARALPSHSHRGLAYATTLGNSPSATRVVSAWPGRVSAAERMTRPLAASRVIE